MELFNDFHGTKAVVQPDERGYISAAAVRRAWKKLCGLSTCKCGRDAAGTRMTGIHIERVDVAEKWYRVVSAD